MTTIACVVIASAKRRELLDELVMPSVLARGWDEIVVVGDYHSGKGYRHLYVPPVTSTTIDALMKRDTALAATKSDVIVYLCDDHRLDPDFVETLKRQYLTRTDWHALAPDRYCVRDEQEIWLNMGAEDGYIGGHAGIYRRECLRDVPWMVAPHDRLWDVWHSKMLTEHGWKIQHAEFDLAIEDVEPNAEPWR